MIDTTIFGLKIAGLAMVTWLFISQASRISDLEERIEIMEARVWANNSELRLP